MCEAFNDVVNQPEGIVLSLYDHSGNMVRPWAERGYETYAVDIKHEDNERTEDVGGGSITYVAADITDWLPPRREYAFVSCFPPCDSLAVSGARWFKQKGLTTLDGAIDRVVAAKEIAEWAEPEYGWMIENPVSTLSSYWRDPDYTFDPYEYDNYTENDDQYTKKTCLWTSDEFVMPTRDGGTREDADSRIHDAPPSEDRAEWRAKTPMGFARAVHQANDPLVTDPVSSIVSADS